MSPASPLVLWLCLAGGAPALEADAPLEPIQAWVDAHPGDPESGRALVWMAQRELSAGRAGRARLLFERAEREHRGSGWELAASKGLADLALRARRYGEAIARYEGLAASRDDYYRFLGESGAVEARATRSRDLLAAGLALLVSTLASARLALAWRSRRTLRPVPEEVFYGAPVAGALLLAALAQPAAEGRAVAALALGGLLLLWANASYFRVRPPRGFSLALEGVLSVAQAGALLYCAVVANGLWGRLIVTFAVGPD